MIDPDRLRDAERLATTIVRRLEVGLQVCEQFISPGALHPHDARVDTPPLTMRDVAMLHHAFSVLVDEARTLRDLVHGNPR